MTVPRSINKGAKRRKNKNKDIKDKDNISRSEAPVSMGFVSRYREPTFKSVGNNVFIKHREYISDVTATLDFAVLKKFAMNPGLADSFPWLSAVASRFEKYRFHKLVYRYETDAPTTTSGSIMLVPDFDAEDVAPISKIAALSYKSSVRSQVWERVSTSFFKEDLTALPQYFVRTTQVANTDIKTYDVGNMFICSSGSSEGKGGEIWVEYEVELISPTIDAQPNGPFWLYIQGNTFAAPDQLFGVTRAVQGNLNITVASNNILFNEYLECLVTVYYQVKAGAVPSDLFLTPSAGSLANGQGNVVDVVEESGSAIYQCRMLAGSTLTSEVFSSNGDPIFSKIYITRIPFL